MSAATLFALWGRLDREVVPRPGLAESATTGPWVEGRWRAVFDRPAGIAEPVIAAAVLHPRMIPAQRQPGQVSTPTAGVPDRAVTPLASPAQP